MSDAPFPAGEAARSPPVAPRDAASLVVVRREQGRPPRILMGKRGAGHRFMPNVLVFPGGAVDPADFDVAPATDLRPAVRARVERSATPALARALAVAAARELAEETGLSLGTPPALDALDYLCRAITPPDRSMRFDARFFGVDAAHVTGDPAGSAELEAPGWYTLEEARAGELALATRAVLMQVERWLMGGLGATVPVLRERAWTEE